MRLSFSAALLLLCSCSVYLPLDPDVPPPVGTNVRARLTTPGAVRISDRLGAPLREIEGEVLGFWGDSLGLNLMSTTEYGRPWDSVDTLKLATLEVYEFHEKRLDMKRTAFLVGGAGIVTGIVLRSIYNAVGGSDGGDGPGDIDAIVIPFFSIRH